MKEKRTQAEKTFVIYVEPLIFGHQLNASCFKNDEIGAEIDLWIFEGRKLSVA
jgi:hypothetical protein